MFDLTNRSTIFASLPPHGIGAEIGVDWGHHVFDIKRLSQPRLLWLIDCWEVQPVEVYGSDPANSHFKEKYRMCLERFMFDPTVRLLKEYSQEAATLFPDGYFDWLYIDSNHLQCYQDMTAWWPKVRSQGYLMGHDYCMVGDYITVKQDVDRFTTELHLEAGITLDLDPEHQSAYKSWVLQKP